MATVLTSSEIEAVVMDALSQVLKRDVSDLPSTTRIDTLGMDSLSVIGMVGELEETFNVELDDAGIRGSDTIGSITHSIEMCLVRR